MSCCMNCKNTGSCQDAYQFSVIQEAGKDLIVWGPVSVESVSQDDKLIRIAAIEAALPHFWKRGALTMLHKDALIVGRVEELIKDVEASDVAPKARSLVEELQEKHGGLPTGVLTVTEGMVQAFPHLASVKGTRQFFAAARVYNDGEQASQAAIQEIKNGELDSFSLAGMPIEAQEVEHCQDGACRTVLDVSKMTLSAITLGSRHGGSGPFSARTRNNGAALITVTQAANGDTEVTLEEGQGQPDNVFLRTTHDAHGETMSSDPAQQQTDDSKTEEAVEQQDEDEGVDVEALASAVQDLARRVEGLEQRLGDSEEEADDEEKDDEEEMEEAKKTSPMDTEAVAQAVKKAVEQATKPLQKRINALEGHKVFEQADTPTPASDADPKKEAALALEQAEAKGDPYAVKEALHRMRGDAA